MLCSGKIQFLFVLFMLNFASSSTSAQKVKRESQPPSAFMRIYAKLDHLSARLDQLESNGNDTAFDAHQFIANITHAISYSNQHMIKIFEETFFKKMETFEQNNFKKMEKIEQNFNKKIDENLIKTEKIEENNLKKMEEKIAKKMDENLIKIEKIEENNLKKMEEKVAKKIDKFEENTFIKMEKIEQNLKKIIEENLKKMETATTTTMPTTTTTKSPPIIVCHPINNPCLHGGKCQPSSTGSDYKCVCPIFRSGSRCQNFECAVERRCWTMKGTFYTVIESKLHWSEAKVKCESLNMTLAMPKDQERTQWLIDQLKPIYGRHHSYVWMGLEGNEGAGGWVWLDGSALGEYVGGSEYIKRQSLSNRGAFCVSCSGSSHWWVGGNGNEFYPLCQTQLISH